eukprot:scaffold2455_cov387-Prasinococcus_capsulatus_cf.AAC.18
MAGAVATGGAARERWRRHAADGAAAGTTSAGLRRRERGGGPSTSACVPASGRCSGRVHLHLHCAAHRRCRRLVALLAASLRRAAMVKQLLAAIDRGDHDGEGPLFWVLDPIDGTLKSPADRAQAGFMQGGDCQYVIGLALMGTTQAVAALFGPQRQPDQDAECDDASDVQPLIGVMGMPNLHKLGVLELTREEVRRRTDLFHLRDERG